MTEWVSVELLASWRTFPLLVIALIPFALGLRRIARKLRDRRHHRILLERIASALSLPRGGIDTHGSGVLGIDLPRNSAVEIIENEGSYRGRVPVGARPVDTTGRTWTRLVAPISKPQGFIRVRPQSEHPRLGEIAMQTLEGGLGDAAFDDAFRVQASPINAAPRVLVHEIRKLMLQLPRSDESPRFTVDGEAIRIEWHGEPEPQVVQHVASALRRVAQGVG